MFQPTVLIKHALPSCALITLLVLSPPLPARDVTLATGVNSDPPYVYGNLEIAEDNPGITIDILHRVSERTGISFEISKRPWARVVHDVKTNHLDGGFHFSYKEKRKAFVVYPILEGQQEPDRKYSISDRSYHLYGLRGYGVQWNGDTISKPSAEPMIIAAIRGGSITGFLKDRGYTLTEVDTDEQMIELLMSKRIDAFAAIDNMLDPKINALFPEDRIRIEKVQPALRSKPYYIAFSKDFYQKHPQLAWKIWEEIHRIKQSGELIKLFERYALVNKQQELEAIQAEIDFLKKYREIQNQAKESAQEKNPVTP